MKPSLRHLSYLNPARRQATLTDSREASPYDVVVIGLGVTGAGVALDAASRGLRVLAVDAHDLAFGTSRWSSKLVHGGLRYLAKGQVGVAYESAVERGILMTTTAPHLVRAIQTFVPLNPRISHSQAALARAGFWSGDLLRWAARTPRAALPRPRRLRSEEALRACPSLDPRELRGALMAYDGQLEDDARLVTALTRTAAAYGADVLTHCRASQVSGTGLRLTDELTGESWQVATKVVINASGVWASDVVPGLKLKPSRGTHLVVRAEAIPALDVALTAPVPGESNRFVFALPQPDGLIYIGLTDIEVDGEIPEVPQGSDAEIDFLLEVINGVLARPLTRQDVVGSYAGLRPLLQAEGRTSDLSRKHAVLTSDDGVVTVVGGKLTTYRQMAQDAVDAACAQAGLHDVRPCQTKALPIVGAPQGRATTAQAPTRLVRKYGAEAAEVQALGERVLAVWPDVEALDPIAPPTPVTWAEVIWAIWCEGAVTVDDVLERRTRIALVPADAALARPNVIKALGLYAETSG